MDQKIKHKEYNAKEAILWKILLKSKSLDMDPAFLRWLVINTCIFNSSGLMFELARAEQDLSLGRTNPSVHGPNGPVPSVLSLLYFEKYTLFESRS